MFNLLRPYGSADILHPVLQQEWPRLRWLRTPDAVNRYNRIVLIGIPTIVGLWWFLERLNLNFGSVPPAFEAILTNLLLVASLGLMIVSSFGTVVATIGPLNRQLTTGQWDDLRITSLRESDVVMAKDAVAQLRVWPIVVVEVGLRLASVGLFVANSLYLNFQFTTASAIPICCYAYALIFGIGLVYIVEPVLRMRLLIAFCTAIALRIQNLNLALLTGFVTALLVHLAQLILVGRLEHLYQISIAAGGYTAIFGILCGFLPSSLISAAIFYAIYIGVRKAALSFAVRKAFAAR
jgi:hypothetical protein